MNGIGSTIVKLLIASLVLGMAMSLFGINPLNLIEHFGQTIQTIFVFVVDLASWGARYVMLGAIVVVPIWLILRVLNTIGRRNRE